MSGTGDHRNDDETITHLLRDAEHVLDIAPGSLQQGKRALRAWMADGEDASQPEPGESTASLPHPGARPRFIAWNPHLTLKSPAPPYCPDDKTAVRLQRPTGDHAYAAAPTSDRCGTSVHRGEGATAALCAVSELHTRLMREQASPHTDQLHQAVADAEEELIRTGRLSLHLLHQLRIALTDAPLDPALKASAQALAQLLDEQ